MTVQDAVNWCNGQIGQHDDYDNAYGTQCVDFFNFYYRYLTGRNPYNDGLSVSGAKDLFDRLPGSFSKVVNNPNDPNQLPPQGAILFWGGNMPGSGGYGHVAVVDRADATNIVVWEEVPGSNVLHTTRRWSSPAEHWELGWWVFSGFDTYVTLDELNTIYQNLLHHAPDQSGINYYVGHYPADVVEDDIKHTQEYIDLNTPKAPPAPYVAPSGALSAPSLDPYLVVKDIPGYLSAGQALAHGNSASTVKKGTYTIYNRQGGMVNVTATPNRPGWWINPTDNAIEPFVSAFPTDKSGAPVEPDWHETYRAIVNKDGIRTPMKYVALVNYVVKDLATQKADVPLHAGDILYVAGTFKKDGQIWCRPLDAVQDRQGNFRGWWYGIPADGQVIEPYEKLYDDQTTTAERQILGELDAYDRVVIAVEWVARKLTDLFNKKKK
jgi:hypothetical protein